MQYHKLGANAAENVLPVSTLCCYLLPARPISQRQNAQTAFKKVKLQLYFFVIFRDHNSPFM